MKIKYYQTKKYLIILCIMCGIGFQSLAIFSKTPTELGTIIPDDTYYYLKIAQNIALGKGSVFSINKPTNGYHPLWLCINIIPFKIFNFENLSYYLYFILGIAILLNFFTSISFNKLLLDIEIGFYTRLVALILFLFNPLIVFLTCNGMETALLFLIFINLLRFYYHYSVFRHNISIKTSLIIGLLSGLMILARTDSILFLTIVALFEVFRAKSSILIFKRWLIISITAFIIVLPWLIWNYFTFKTFFQSSSYAVMIQNYKVFKIDYNVETFFHPKLLLKILHNFFYAFKLFFRIITPNPIIVNNYTILGFLLVFISAFSFFHKRIKAKKFNAEKFHTQFILFRPLCIFVCVIFFLIVFIRWYMQPWHFSMGILLLLILVILYFTNLKLKIRQKTIVIIVLICILFNSLLTIYTFRNGFYWFGPNSIKDINALNINEKYQYKKIGVFDAGYISFYSPNVEVVNLDGVVNNAALRYIKNDILKQYILKEKFFIVFSSDKYDKIFKLK